LKNDNDNPYHSEKNITLISVKVNKYFCIFDVFLLYHNYTIFGIKTELEKSGNAPHFLVENS
ncbi:MAG TPA: hypothetical protein DEB37_10715, partial [Lysinibacillus sp.]|nr:hypothetical protein [Lysinibacillus sp.]